MRGKHLEERARNFAIKIINESDNIRANPRLIDQLVRSGTSIGANVCESQYAQSRADFISKLEIALKECYETEYWLDLLLATGKMQEEKCLALLAEAGTLRRMLIKICKTAKIDE